MTQDRDAYMRRQEADHDLLRMRGSQAFGRGLRAPLAQTHKVVTWELPTSHTDWIYNQQPFPDVHQALLSLDDPCDDCAHWLWYIEVRDVMSMPPDPWVKMYKQEWNCS